VIVKRIAKTLLAPQVSLRCLNQNNPKPGQPVPFCFGEDGAGSVELSRGKARFTTTTPAAGASTVTATYSGDSNMVKGSAGVTQTVQP
jgi:Bacterial Ig-like domain (group 3)